MILKQCGYRITRLNRAIIRQLAKERGISQQAVFNDIIEYYKKEEGISK